MKKISTFLLLFLPFTIVFSQASINEDQVLATMKSATKFMREKVSNHGGYLWAYTSDRSRQWGEMEAYKSMIWIQPPGTPTVGNLYLDAYHATKDEYYFKAAIETASALISAQTPSGGWNYMYDFNGEKSLKNWYKTIGKNGWRLEEFQEYQDNATFDDGGTIEAATLLLRLYLEKENHFIKAALDKAINFVLESQYSNGGWPQRYPTKNDYTSNITFNDDVAAKNILFLILCYNEFNDQKVLDAIHKGMNAYIELQLPSPQAGWSLQYTKDGNPASARTYEPKCVSTSATENNVYQLLYFYSLTGDHKFVRRVLEAINWLEEQQLPDSLVVENRTHPTFVELVTDKPIYIHRRGSNIKNGEYYIDYKPNHTLCHYRSTRKINTKKLRLNYNKLVAANPEFVTAHSPLKEKQDFPKYFSRRNGFGSDLNSKYVPYLEATDKNVRMVISKLNNEGYWPTPLVGKTNPYIGKACKEITPGDFSSTNVGDLYDTSPYVDINSKDIGISTGVYIKNMNLLIEYLVNLKTQKDLKK